MQFQVNANFTPDGYQSKSLFHISDIHAPITELQGSKVKQILGFEETAMLEAKNKDASQATWFVPIILTSNLTPQEIFKLVTKDEYCRSAMMRRLLVIPFDWNIAIHPISKELYKWNSTLTQHKAPNKTTL